jgi:hypothetical protein
MYIHIYVCIYICLFALVTALMCMHFIVSIDSSQAFTEPPVRAGGSIGKAGLGEYQQQGYFSVSGGE